MTKLTNTTPSPWTYDRVVGEVYGPKNTGEVVVVYGGGLQFPSDGHLIAAAPELESALRNLLSFTLFLLEDPSRDEDAKAIREARAALAKARGE